VVNQTIHHALVCHGHAVRAVREHGGRGARVGLTDNCETVVPLSETPDDIAALTAFLCSDAGGFVNGQMIASNGGAQT
jgi:beta-glucosidase